MRSRSGCRWERLGTYRMFCIGKAKTNRRRKAQKLKVTKPRFDPLEDGLSCTEKTAILRRPLFNLIMDQRHLKSHCPSGCGPNTRSPSEDQPATPQHEPYQTC